MRQNTFNTSDAAFSKKSRQNPDFCVLTSCLKFLSSTYFYFLNNLNASNSTVPSSLVLRVTVILGQILF